MANVFNVAKKQILDGTIDIDGDTLRVMLFTTSPASLTAALQDLATVAAVLGDAAFTEAADSSYTGQGASGRLTLGSVTVTQDDTNERGEADVADVTWTALNSMTLTGAMVFKFVTNDSDSIPIAFYDFSSDLVCNGGDVTIQWNSEGFLHLT